MRNVCTAKGLFVIQSENLLNWPVHIFITCWKQLLVDTGHKVIRTREMNVLHFSSTFFLFHVKLIRKMKNENCSNGNTMPTLMKKTVIAYAQLHLKSLSSLQMKNAQTKRVKTENHPNNKLHIV